MAEGSSSPLSLVAAKLANYAHAQRLALSNADVEERRGFFVLRELIRDARAAHGGANDDVGGAAALTASYLSVLALPAHASDLAALPLPHPSAPCAAPPAELNPLHAHAPGMVGGLTVLPPPRLPPLAHTAAPLPLSSPTRSAAAHAAAAGASNEQGGAPSYGFDPSGTRLCEHASLLSWTRQAEVALGGLLHTVRASCAHALPLHVAVQLVVTLAPFLCYTAWAVPESCAAADAVLAAAAGEAGREGGARSTQSHPALSPSAASFVLRHVDALLDWCRSKSLGGAWKERGSAGVRWVTLLTLTCIPFPHMTHTRAALALPLIFRMVDDWEVTNVWVGCSALSHVLLNATPSDLRTGAGGLAQPRLLQESLTRARNVRHPTLAHVTAYTLCLYVLVMHGVPPPPVPATVTPSTLVSVDSGAFERALRNGSTATSPGGTSIGLFDHPSDTAVGDLLRSLALAGGAGVQYGIVVWLAPLLLLMGGRAGRHRQDVVSVGAKLAVQSADARLICAGLHLLRSLVLAAPDSFTGGLDGAQAVDEVLSSCAHAALQAVARFTFLPVVNEEGLLSGFAAASGGGGVEGDPAAPASAAGEEAGGLVLAYARATLASLRRVAPAAVARALTGVRLACGGSGREGAEGTGPGGKVLLVHALDALEG